MTKHNSQPRKSRPRTPKRRTAIFVGLLLAATTLGGCIVNTQSRAGILEVRWDVVACTAKGIATVAITVRRNGIAAGSSGPVACTKGFHSFSVQPGTYNIDIRAKDSAGNEFAAAFADGVRVNANATSTTSILSLQQAQSTSGGKITVRWTVLGQHPSVGCTKYGIKEVTISILNSKQTLVNAQATVPCKVGQVTMANVPAGEAYIQLDGITTDKLLYYGNLALYGPIQIPAGAAIDIPTPLDIGDLRSSIAVGWQFANSNTCDGNNISNVFVEVRSGNDKIVVPMNAPDAKKPCEIDANTPYKARVIDMLSETPTCTIPVGATGLIICGITDTSIGIRISAANANGQILFGGSMKVQEIPAGSHTNLPTRISLAQCSAANPCTAP